MPPKIVKIPTHEEVLACATSDQHKRILMDLLRDESRLNRLAEVDLSACMPEQIAGIMSGNKIPAQ